MWYRAVCSNELDARTRARFTVLSKLDHVLVGIADADVENSRSLLGGLGAEVDKETTDDRGKNDEANGYVFAWGAQCSVGFFYAAHACSYEREFGSEKPEFVLCRVSGYSGDWVVLVLRV